MKPTTQISTLQAASRGLPAAEPAVALRLAGLLLLALLAAKALAPVPLLGTVVASLVTFAQLYVPLRRCEAAGQPLAAIGLSGAAWRGDAARALGCAALILPLYAAAVHWALCDGAAWAQAAGWPQAAAWLPRGRWAPRLPDGAAAWGAALALQLGACATHVLGVALPEETFYRGYLQAQLQRRRPAPYGGRGLGAAAVLSCALFALGHLVGEWQPARLLPFFPGLLFGLLRNRSGSVVGAVLLHGACNVFSALWLAAYQLR